MEPQQRRGALRRYRCIAPWYNAVGVLNRGLRAEAVGRLELAPGQTVLDVGCGTGLIFPPLQGRVGPSGRIIGLELSPHMLARARARVAAQGWQNVTLLQGSAEEVAAAGSADAALLFFVHDVMQSESALRQVLAALRSGGRVVAAGVKRPQRWGMSADTATFIMFAPFATTMDGSARPWVTLERILEGGLTVEERWASAAYLAYGEIAPTPDP